MDGERLGIKNMGKDIDRNITRQLWERLKNTFTISIKPSSAITDIYSNNYKGFISFPV